MKHILQVLLARAEWKAVFFYFIAKAHIISTYHYYVAYGRVFIARRLVNLTKQVLATQPVSQVVDEPEPDVEPDFFFYDEVTQVVEEVLPAAVQDELVYLEGLNDARYEMWDAFIENGRWDATEVYDEELPVFVNVEKLS